LILALWSDEPSDKSECCDDDADEDDVHEPHDV
jgi:hypothetical protein